MASPPSKLTLALDRAISAYRAGRLGEAEEICQKVVAAKRNFFDGLHVLAVVQAAAGKYDLALANYNRAISLQPKHAEALNNRGNALQELKRFEEALVSYDRALAAKPNFAAALNNRGVTLRLLKQLEPALASLDRALVLEPCYAEALYNRASVLHDMRRLDEALASYDRALAVRAFAEAFSARSSTLRALERFDEALVSCDRALALQPNYVDALDNRGSTLREMKRFDESLASFDRAIALRPDHADLYNNRANTLREMYRLDEALASYDRALSLRPSLVEAINNRGMILQDMGRFDEALACCSQALALQPDLAEAHWIQGTVRLLTGDFPRGWPDYEWRWEKADTAAAKRNFLQPLWLGEHDLSGRTILLDCEQGLGDTIQFCRYVPLVAARGANVILEVQGPLQTLMSTLAGPSSIVARGSPLPDVDFQCPLLASRSHSTRSLRRSRRIRTICGRRHRRRRIGASGLGRRSGPGSAWYGPAMPYTNGTASDHCRSALFCR